MYLFHIKPIYLFIFCLPSLPNLNVDLLFGSECRRCNTTARTASGWGAKVQLLESDGVTSANDGFGRVNNGNVMVSCPFAVAIARTAEVPRVVDIPSARYDVT